MSTGWFLSIYCIVYYDAPVCPKMFLENNIKRKVFEIIERKVLTWWNRTDSVSGDSKFHFWVIIHLNVKEENGWADGEGCMLLSLFTSTGPTNTLPNQQTIKNFKTVPWVQPSCSLAHVVLYKTPKCSRGDRRQL